MSNDYCETICPTCNPPKPEGSVRVDGVLGRDWTLDWGHVTEGPTISSTVKVIERAVYDELLKLTSQAQDTCFRQLGHISELQQAYKHLMTERNTLRDSASIWSQRAHKLYAELDALVAQLADANNYIESLEQQWNDHVKCDYERKVNELKDTNRGLEFELNDAHTSLQEALVEIERMGAREGLEDK